MNNTELVKAKIEPESNRVIILDGNNTQITQIGIQGDLSQADPEAVIDVLERSTPYKVYEIISE